MSETTEYYQDLLQRVNDEHERECDKLQGRILALEDELALAQERLDRVRRALEDATFEMAR